MATLRALTSGRVVDLVITWPEMDAKRNRPFMLAQHERWTAFFGTDAWAAIVRTRGGATVLRELQGLYVRQLQSLGYTAEYLRRSVKNRQRVSLYRSLFASRDPLGLKFWAQASATPQMQGALFE